MSGSAFATIAGDNSVLSGSAFASDAVTSGSEFAANAALSASASGSVDPSTGLITKAVAPSDDGLYLGASNLGFYEGGKWRTYMDDNGQFFLTGSDDTNYLRWNGTTLEIGGAIVITGGGGSTDLTSLNEFTSSQNSINSNLNAATSSYLGSSTQFDFGGNGFTLDTVSLNGAGLYLGSDKLGYYDNSAWKTYMDNAGQFFLGGTSGNLTWDGTNLLINGTITASAGYIGTPTDGFNIQSDYIGNGKATLTDGNSGVYVGTDGIALGASNVFSVTDVGTLTKTSANVEGDITATGGTIAGWSVSGNTLSAGDILLDAGNEKIQVTDKLQIRTGAFSSRTTTTISTSIPAFTFVGATFSTTSNMGQVNITPSTGGAGSFTVSDTGIYSFSIAANQYDKTNFLTNNSYNGMFFAHLEMQIRTAASGGGSLVGTIQLSQAFGSPQPNSDLDTYTSTQYVTFNSAGTYYMWVRLNVSNYATGGSYSSAPLSETAYSISLSKNANFTEVTDRGIQAVGSTTRWVSMDINGTYAFESEGALSVNGQGNPLYLRGQLHPYVNNTHNIGGSGMTWNTIYLQNTPNVASDRRLKNSITGSDLGLDFVNSLNPIRYKWNDAETPRYHYGLIAQELTSSLSTFGHTSDDIGFINSSSLDTDLIALKGWEEEGGESLPDYEVYQSMVSSSADEELTVKYTELISPMIKAIQELSAKVVQLENQISGSE